MSPQPPRRGQPPVTEVNAAIGPHTPVPPPDALPTAPPPPAMPMAPPRGLQGPRTRMGSRPDPDPTLVGLGPVTDADRKLYEAEHLRVQQLQAELDLANQRISRLPAEAPQRSMSPPPNRADLLKAGYKLMGAATLLMSVVATYLGARAATNEPRVDNAVAAVSAQKVVTDPLPEKVKEATRDSDSCREWARLYSDYDRQIFRKLGVVIPEPENSKPIDPIKTVARIRKPNITSAPILEVLSPPPPLP